MSPAKDRGTRETSAAAAAVPAAGSRLFPLLMLAGAVGLYVGWKLFWFLTDDAYIVYRYVSNSVQGYGYVWNAPPFLPVEGYTSFLWVVLLDAVWRVTGVDPPRSANVISLVFSYGTLLLGAAAVMKLPWRESLKKFRALFVALLLVDALTNRTFLAWTSSGLETAMFNFFVTLWVFVVFFISSPTKRIALASLVSVAIVLTRPDGLLFIAGTCVMMVLLVRAAPDRKSANRIVLGGAAPLVVALIHEAWRVSFYGAWLPNSYYAKVMEPWPLSGSIYASSFLLEYTLWFPLAIAGWALIAPAGRKKLRGGASREKKKQPSSLLQRLGSIRGPHVAIAVLILHAAYYTFMVGGDHFEYRVYSHLVVLLFVAWLWFLNRLGLKPAAAGGLAVSFILLSLPVPWTHWEQTRHLQTRKETLGMRVPIAPVWPGPLRGYAHAFDRCQFWLIARSACVRYQEHKVFMQTQMESYPSRAVGERIGREGYPVHVAGGVGYPSWVFPNVNIIDKLGLNDYVIARTPMPRHRFRKLFHGRLAPPGYAESFRPNVAVDGTVRTRAEPLTADEIRRLESYWRGRAAHPR